MAVDSRVGTTFGKYNITRMIGKGGMGEVFEAYDTAKRRTVALKILADQFSNDDTFRTRFQRESHAAAILQEPHVIPIHDWGEIDGNLYIDMRLVQGQTLADLLVKGPLAPPRAVAIISQVAAALDAAHAEGLIHRDVKPQNIIITPADFAYLVDFGIAETRGDTRLTVAGTQIGTFNYMAPERFTGQVVATSAVDVYALACVLYESLTGNTPFATDSLENLAAAHIASPPPRPSVDNPRVPTAFDDVVARGMAKDPDDRYGTTGGLGRAAQRALQTGGPNVANAMTVPPPGGFTSPVGGAAPSFVGSVASPYAGPTMVPPSGPTPVGPTSVPPDRDSGQRGRGWVLPTVIAVAAAFILGGIGVVIGLLAHRNSGQAAGPAPSTVIRRARRRHPQGCPRLWPGPTRAACTRRAMRASRCRPRAASELTPGGAHPKRHVFSATAYSRRTGPSTAMRARYRVRCRPLAPLTAAACQVRCATARTSSCTASSSRATAGSLAPGETMRVSICGECSLRDRNYPSAARRSGRSASWPSR
jgi:serine/threonine-protein kinase